MAVSKSTRSSDSDTSERIEQLFRNSRVSAERKDEWHQAIQQAATMESPLRFPLYEHLYSINLHAQKLVDLLIELDDRYGIAKDHSLCLRLHLQYLRASVSGDIVHAMGDIELTEAWIFQGLYRQEEEKLAREAEVS